MMIDIVADVVTKMVTKRADMSASAPRCLLRRALLDLCMHMHRVNASRYIHKELHEQTKAVKLH